MSSGGAARCSRAPLFSHEVGGPGFGYAGHRLPCTRCSDQRANIPFRRTISSGATPTGHGPRMGPRPRRTPDPAVPAPRQSGHRHRGTSPTSSSSTLRRGAALGHVPGSKPPPNRLSQYRRCSRLLARYHRCTVFDSYSVLDVTRPATVNARHSDACTCIPCSPRNWLLIPREETAAIRRFRSI